MKKMPFVVLVLVAAQVLSGCFVLRESNWTKDKVKAGKSTRFVGSLVGSGEADSYFFILPMLEGDISIRKPVFDANKDLGKRRELVQDAQLGAIALDSGNGCDAAVVPPRREGPPPPTPAYKTTKEIAAPENKFADSTFKVKVAKDSLSGPVGGIVYVGYWNDDGDGIPEDNDDDAINCTGFTTSMFLVK